MTKPIVSKFSENTNFENIFFYLITTLLKHKSHSLKQNVKRNTTRDLFEILIQSFLPDYINFIAYNIKIHATLQTLFLDKEHSRI